MIKALLISALSYLVFLGGHALALETSKYAGTWQVDVIRTMEELKKTLEDMPEEAVETSARIKKMIPQVKLKFTGTEITLVIDGKEMKSRYTVESGTGTSVVLVPQKQDVGQTLTVTQIDGKLLKVKSSVPDDLNHLVWKRAP